MLQWTSSLFSVLVVLFIVLVFVSVLPGNHSTVPVMS